jgi:hypothetical protein
MTDDIDLDELAPEPKGVKLGGTRYLVPADIPLPLSIRLSRLSGEPDDSSATDLYEEVLALFRVHQPDLKSLPIGASQLFSTILAIYGPKKEPDPTPAKPRAKRAGTKSTSRNQSRPRSRS